VTLRPGSTIAVRDIAGEAILFAWPFQVVEDTGARLLATQVPDSVGKVTRGYPDELDGLLEELVSGHPTLVDLAWARTFTLAVFRPDAWWSTRLMWDAATDDLACYYVDFRKPVERNGVFLDTLDLGLDLVVHPDGSWVWKDEDHLELARAAGWLTEQGDVHIERAREEVVAAVERQHFPFDGSLLSLRPSAESLPPQLPGAWDSLGMP
jgi:hypothetical protein